VQVLVVPVVADPVHFKYIKKTASKIFFLKNLLTIAAGSQYTSCTSMSSAVTATMQVPPVAPVGSGRQYYEIRY
jgi:hypothetical protein